MTGYYKKLLRTNETVLHRGKLHWRVYLRAFGFFLVGAALIGAGGAFQGPAGTIIGFPLLLLAAIAALGAWWRRLTTEIIITDMRVIWKRNWVAVKTREINLSKIETVDIRQSIFDRLIGSGTVIMIGTGGSWEPIWPVAKPPRLAQRHRRRMTARPSRVTKSMNDSPGPRMASSCARSSGVNRSRWR